MPLRVACRVVEVSHYRLSKYTYLLSTFNCVIPGYFIFLRSTWSAVVPRNYRVHSNVYDIGITCHCFSIPSHVPTAIKMHTSIPHLAIFSALLLSRPSISLAPLVPPSQQTRDPLLPNVDLGYAVYRPTSFNQTGNYYNFSNIRYAAPPLGYLRFSDPAPPLNERSKGIQDGTTGYVCPQAEPAGWAAANAALGPEGAVIPAANSSLPESEDCLFLDVIVPTSVFHAGKAAPVLINIHGGGFFIGDKTTLYDPQGLLAASRNDIVFVSMNYRVGGFHTSHRSYLV